MREKLQRIDGQRATFTGVFTRFGRRPRWCGSVKTVLLRDVRTVDGEQVTDHVWIGFTEEFEQLCPLQPGERVQFDARVETYQKGYRGIYPREHRPVEHDYRLARPTEVERLEA